jgi:protein involved in polysaccharide export with SLBB domain
VKLFQNHDTAYDIMLSDGDHVNIPRRSSYVNVIGRVVQPGRVAFVPDGRLNDYLQSAGGYAWRANRGGTFVIKSGTGAAVKKGDVGTIEPGDIIVVPTVRDRDLWKGVKDVLAVAANLATVYLVIDQATK